MEYDLFGLLPEKRKRAAAATPKGPRPLPPVPDTGWRMPDTFPSLEGQGIIAVDIETQDPDLIKKGPGEHRGGRIVGVALGTEAGFRAYYPIGHEQGPNLSAAQVLPWVQEQLRLPVPKLGANLLYDLSFLATAGVHATGPFYDVQVAEPLLDENRQSYSLESLAQKYLGEGKNETAMSQWLGEAFGDNVKGNIWRAPASIIGPYAESDVDLPLRIFAKQRVQLESLALWNLFIMESKLIPILLAMRQRGVRVDVPHADELYNSLAKQQAQIVENIKHEAMVDTVELWEAKSVAAIFDKIGVAYLHTDKTGAPSFRRGWLEQHSHPVANLITEARRLDKLKETFIKGYIQNSHIDGRIHCQFHQLRSDDSGTVSGRFSCVAGWTPILTSKEIKPIKTVKVGDLVWTHQKRWRPVTAIWLKGLEQMVALHLDNGYILTCTKQHRIMLASGAWISVGELYEHIQKVVKQPREYKKSSAALSWSRIKNYAANCRRIVRQLSNYFTQYSFPYDKTRTQSSGYASIFGSQDWPQESNEGQGCRETSQLEGGMQRSQRLSDHQTAWSQNLCTSSCDVALAGARSLAEGDGNSPYRQQSLKQQQRQLGYYDQQRTSSTTCDDELSYQQRVFIKKIEISGGYEVYDITVAEDESYEACGVFSHNSSQPNLQNIPSQGNEAPLIRQIFLPEEGQSWWHFDWSQIEYRLIVHYAARRELKGAQEVVDQYTANANADYHQLVADMTGLPRYQAKTLNFGLAYGQGLNLLCKNLGVDQIAGSKIISQYHKAAPFIRPLAQKTAAHANELGVIRTLLGRHRRFQKWELWDDQLRKMAYYDEEVPNSQRAFTHKALNALVQGSAADIMKRAMVDSWEAGVYDVLGPPHLTVHDELDGSIDPANPAAVEALKELKHIMESCVTLKVPLRCDGAIGPNWGSV